MASLHSEYLWLEAIEPNVNGERVWKQFWFVLDEGYMRYFFSESDVEPLATIPCRGIVAKAVGKSRVGKHAFRLDVTRQEDGRCKYVLAGHDEADSIVWLEFLRDHGASVNLSKIRLTARPEGESDTLTTRLLSFGQTATRFMSFGGQDRKRAATTGDKPFGFLSFSQGSRKTSVAAPAPAPADQVSSASGAAGAPASGDGPLVTPDRGAARKTSFAGPPPNSMSPRRSSLVLESPLIAQLAVDGDIDGDAPYADVLKSMSRQSYLQASKSFHATGVAAGESDDSLAGGAGAPPSLGASPRSSSRQRLSVEDLFAAAAADDATAQPAGTPGGLRSSSSSALAEEAAATGEGPGVVEVHADEDSDDGNEDNDEAVDDAAHYPDADDADEAEAEPSMTLPSLSSFGNSFASALRLSGAQPPEPTQPPGEIQYGANYAAPSEAPPPLTSRLSHAASDSVAAVGEALSPKSLAKVGSSAVDAVGAVGGAVGDAVTGVGGAVGEAVTGIAARLSFASGEEAPPVDVADPQEPPPPPKPTIEDSPAEAQVRAWLRAVLLGADDLKTLERLNDRTVPLRGALRDGIVLCGALNALKPKAVGKVKAPAAGAKRFAQLEALQTYKRSCGTCGLTERDCLQPDEWLDGHTLVPLYEHLSALCRIFPSAPKFVPPGGLRKTPTKGSVSGSRIGMGGVVPFATADDIMKSKGNHGKVTRSAVAAGNSAFKGAGSNAMAAKAVFEAEKGGTGSGGGGGGGPVGTLERRGTSSKARTGVQTTVRSNTGATHSFAESETIAFSEFINDTLGTDEDVAHLLPIDVEAEDFTLFDTLRDGVVLCKLINCAVADTIDLRAVHTGLYKPLSVFEVVENLNMAINAAGAIGCRVVNIGPDDILAGSPHLCLGLLWQIIKTAIMANLNLKASPELLALLGSDMDDADALKALNALAPEKVLLKWLNYQVQRVAPGAKEVTNFGAALKDCTVYAHLLAAVAPPSESHIVAGLPKAIGIEKDPIAKAQIIIDAASQLGVTQFRLMPADIAKGHEKLNMAFAAAIFNHLPGLAASEAEGVFNPALACASAVIKDGGRTVLLSETGSALFGGKMEANTGVHWALLKVVQATEPQVYMGLAPPTVYKAGVVGLEVGTTALEATGTAYVGGSEAGKAANGTWAKGDLLKVEYNSDTQVLRWFKNDVLVSYAAEGPSAAPAGTHFAVGRGGGELEVRLEDSSFMSDAARGAAKLLESLEEDESDSREERAFRMWINSLGLATHVNDLTAESADGLLILETMDLINPGCVEWKKVDKKPKNVHVKTINCNYAVELGKGPSFRFSLVGIGGTDLVQKKTKLVLAIVWQMMRYHVIRLLTSMSGTSKSLTEADVLTWANAKVSAQSGLHPVAKLSDPTLSSGVYVLTLIKAVAPRSVDLSQVAPGVTANEKKLNARLAISCARRAGCLTFALWEDVVETKPKMLLILFATLMQLDIRSQAQTEASSQKKVQRKMSLIGEEEE